MRKPGVIAFPVLLFLGAVTGYLAYDLMVVKSTPVEGVYDNSPYRKEITESAPPQEDEVAIDTESSPPQEEEQPIDVGKSEFTNVVTIAILKGASASGNPDYDPDAATVSADSLITWVNNDSTLHTVTSGTGFDDESYGQLFDSKILASGREFSIPASELGPGEHTYFCTAHPFMVGTVTVE